MALDNFIPQLWSAKIITQLRNNLVFGNLVNRDYEGELKDFGDTVYINELGPVTVNAYTKGATLTYQTLEGADKALRVDQASSFSFKIDSMDKAQTNPKLMDSATNDAAYRIANTIDAFVGGLYAQAGITGSATYIGSASASVTVSSGNCLETLTYVSRYLMEKNVMPGMAWGVISPWFHQKLLLAEIGGIASTGVPKVFDDGLLVNGYVGNACGIQLLVSNNVSTNATQYRMMFGTRNSIGYVGQLSEIETMRLETTFADVVRGLYLYGAKVLDATQLCTVYAAEGAG